MVVNADVFSTHYLPKVPKRVATERAWELRSFFPIINPVTQQFLGTIFSSLAILDYTVLLVTILTNSIILLP